MDVDKYAAYWYAVGIILCSALNVFVVHPYMMGILHMGMKVRVACCSLIYRKTLKMTRTALGETTIGQAVNLLSNDVNRFDVSIIFLHYLWLGPLETIIITYVMYHVIDVGVSSIIGVASLLMFIPLQGRRSLLWPFLAIRVIELDRIDNDDLICIICCLQNSEIFKLGVYVHTLTGIVLLFRLNSQFLKSRFLIDSINNSQQVIDFY